MVTRDDVIERLEHFGYITTSDDYAQLDFELNKILDYVMNYCNITTIPEILDWRICERVCGEFLLIKKNMGQLEDFDYDLVVKQIKEGDTTLTYALGSEGSTPESRFNAILTKLERGFDKVIAPHRKLRW